MKLSEIIHKAADVHLATDKDVNNNTWWWQKGTKLEKYSCMAVERIAFRYGLYATTNREEDLLTQFKAGVKACGCNPFRADQFDDVPIECRQQVRYAWLKFLALLAEEQGL